MAEQKLTPEQKWEQATLADNFIFYKVFRNNPELCRELLEILLEFEISKIQMISEETMEVDYGTRGIRMDIYAKSDNKCFNIEMQVKNTKELPERSRYYQGVIDVDCLKSGEKYSELKDSFIIFICMEDIFEKGYPKYTFRNLCVEDNKLQLNDRSEKLFFSVKECDKLLDERQKSFFHLLLKNMNSDAFTDRLSKEVVNAKHNTQWRKQYMDWERQRTYDFEDGREEGSNQRAIETAENLIKKDLPLQMIAECCRLPLETVQKLAEGLKVTD